MFCANPNSSPSTTNYDTSLFFEPHDINFFIPKGISSFDFVFVLHSFILFTILFMYLTTLPSNVLPFLPLPFVLLLRHNSQLCGFYFGFRVQINSYRTRRRTPLAGRCPAAKRSEFYANSLHGSSASSASSSPANGQTGVSIFQRFLIIQC